MRHKFTDIHSPNTKSPGYYDCLNKVKDPMPTLPKKKELEDFVKVEKEDLDKDWVMVISDIEGNKYSGR